MSWFTDLVQTLPNIKTKFQLTGLIVGVAAYVAVRFAAPDAVVAQICAGSIGVLFLVFGQIFQAIPHFPAGDRVKLVITLFITFVLFILILVVIILYSLSYRPPANSATADLKDDRTVRQALENLADMDGRTVRISKTCSDTFMNAKIRGGTIQGRNTVDLIQQVQHRLKEAVPNAKYEVILSQEGSYVVTCSN